MKSPPNFGGFLIAIFSILFIIIVAAGKGNASSKTFPKKNDISLQSLADLKLMVEYRVLDVGACIDTHFFDSKYSFYFFFGYIVMILFTIVFVSFFKYPSGVTITMRLISSKIVANVTIKYRLP